jgi:hypothetical protein
MCYPSSSFSIRNFSFSIRNLATLSGPQTIDVKTIVFQWPWAAWHFQTPGSLSSSETAGNPGIRSWKTLIWMRPTSKRPWWHIFHRYKWRDETLQPGLELDNLKPGLESSIFKCILWLKGSFFGDDDRGFLKEGVKTYKMALMWPLNSPTFFYLHIYSLWWLVCN